MARCFTEARQDAARRNPVIISAFGMELVKKTALWCFITGIKTKLLIVFHILLKM